jgi:hypothetical protein
MSAYARKEILSDQTKYDLIVVATQYSAEDGLPSLAGWRDVGYARGRCLRLAGMLDIKKENSGQRSHIC